MKKFADVTTIFRRSFLRFLKVVRASPKVRVLVNLPDTHTYFRKLHHALIESPHIKSGAYFRTLGPLDQKTVLMDCMRDVFTALASSEEYVRVEKVRAAPSVISSVATNQIICPSAVDGDDDDALSSLSPDDSVSQVGRSAQAPSREAAAPDDEATSTSNVEEGDSAHSDEERAKSQEDGRSMRDETNHPPAQEEDDASLSSISLSATSQASVSKRSDTKHGTKYPSEIRAPSSVISEHRSIAPDVTEERSTSPARSYLSRLTASSAGDE